MDIWTFLILSIGFVFLGGGFAVYSALKDIGNIEPVERDDE